MVVVGLTIGPMKVRLESLTYERINRKLIIKH
jgi:hypothetical protein